jgi:uncharacterized protein (DUF2235 family)
MHQRLLLLILVASILQSCAITTIPKPYIDERTVVSRPDVLAIFMDGTSNRPQKKPAKNTHVKTIHTLSDTSFRSLYIEGVGAQRKPLGMIKGLGTKARVVKAYRFLSEYYKPGDTICLFGFSRGANQCRILSNTIYTFGLLDLKNVKNENRKLRIIKKSYKAYRVKKPVAERKRLVANYLDSNWNNRHREQKVEYDTTGTVKIALMGLWDNVEAFKIDKKEETTPRADHLNQIINVEKIFHAVSLDDNRAYTYTPVLFNHKLVVVDSMTDFKNKVREVWFAGSHRDVGGGPKKNPEIGNLSLSWMLANVRNYNLFRDTAIIVDSFALIHNARQSFLFKILFANRNRSLDAYYNNMPGDTSNRKIKIHQSVISRLSNGLAPAFKSKRGDWFDLPPFKNCFIKEDKKVILKEGCPCVEVVDAILPED